MINFEDIAEVGEIVICISADASLVLGDKYVVTKVEYGSIDWSFYCVTDGRSPNIHEGRSFWIRRFSRKLL